MGGNDNGSGKFEGFRGVINDIRLLLVDLLGLGKPDAEQQMVIEVFFGLMGYVAKADRLVSSHESNLADSVMDDIDLSLAGRKLAMEAFDRGMRRNINLDAELLRFTDSHPAGSEDNERLHTILLHPTDPDRMYIAISAAGAFRTDDGGATWQPINAGLRSEGIPDEDAEVGHCVHRLALHPSRPDTLFMQKHWDVMRTDDAGGRWREVSGNLPTDFGFPIAVHAHEPRSVGSGQVRGVRVADVERNRFDLPARGPLRPRGVAAHADRATAGSR